MLKAPASRPLDIAGSLRGERIFLTGATGFVGKVLVEKLLWSVPEIGRLLLLVRPDDVRGADERLRDEVLGSPIMARLRALHADGWQAWAEKKVVAVAGDLGQDRFGLDPEGYAGLCEGIDRVVAGAATVRFDERLDRALEVNCRGALRALALARDAGNVPLLQISTCFVSGRRRGTVREGPAQPGAVIGSDPDAVMAALERACQHLEVEPGSAEDADAQFVAAGAVLARRHGFHDVYTLTKNLGERLLERHRGRVPVAVVRPAIVESAAEQPIPGWIDAIRVADPLLVAYGRGRTRDLPGVADAPLELIPVDYVVHALIAALADLRREDQDVRVYQVGSSRNPISLGELMSHARQGFAGTPLRDETGRPIRVGQARFVEPERFRRRLLARRRRVRSLARCLGRLRSTRLGRRLGGAERVLDHFIRLVEVYRPYLSHGASYGDEATRGLWDRLSPADRAVFPFDVAAIDWRSYVAEVHVPGIVRFGLRAQSGAPPASPPSRSSGAERPAAAMARAAAATSLFELFAATARSEPDAMALQTFRDGRWLRYTYDQALTATDNIAWRLASRYGIGPGDRVAVWAGGSPEWVLATFAALRLGAVTVPLDPQWPAAEIDQAARLVGVKLICAAPRLAASLGEAGCPVVELAAPFVPEPEVGPLPGAEIPDAIGKPGGLASIVFTSGTTVAPKAVPLTHENFLANLRGLIPLMNLSRERMLSVLPIHHVFEFVVGLLVPLAGGSTISYVAEIKPAEISWMMATTRPTVMVAVPRLLELLHNGIRQSVAAGGPMLRLLFRLLFALSRLSDGRYGDRLFGKVHRRFGGELRRIVTGGSALEPSLGRSFQLMGFEVAEGYGLTETSPVLTVNPWGQIRFGSVGRPLPGVDVEVRSPIGETVGEVWVRGANVMAGYYENRQATEEVIRDGWFNTGDIGFVDTEGYLHLAGRSKDVIVTAAGKNVYPEEVELRYRDLPGVEELVVLGLPNGGQGERVCAVVVPSPGATEEDVERIRAAIAQRSAEVPSYQRLAGVEIWHGELPKTTTLKVQRRRLRRAVLSGARGKRPSTAAVRPAGPHVAPRSEAENWVVATVARLTGTRPDLLAPSTHLAELGVDSLTRVELVGAIEGRFGLTLDDAAAGALDRVQDLFDLAASRGARAEEEQGRQGGWRRPARSRQGEARP